MDERFSFIEMPGEPTKANAYSVPDIPEQQHLNYLDLIALAPRREALKAVSRKLLTKYQFIPIVAQSPQASFRLPGKLDPQYHLQWKTTGSRIYYIALCYPEREHTLNLIYNALGHGLYGIPIQKETFERFMSERYDLIRKG